MTKSVRVINFIFIIFFLLAAPMVTYAKDIPPTPENDNTSLYNFFFNYYKKTPDIQIDFKPSETYETPANQTIEQPAPPASKSSYQAIEQSSYQAIELQSDQTNKPSITFGDLLKNSAVSEISITPTPTINNSPIASKSAMIAEILAQLEESYRERPRPTLTPFIPVPTLIAGVREIVESNQAIERSSYQYIKNQAVGQATNYSRLSGIPQAAGQLTINKSHYTIALLGDSMVDTLGRDLPHLSQLLRQNYPSISFTLLNYGFGSTDLESGLFRLTNATKYLDMDFLPLLSNKPDILVVESFAYNHWSGQMHDLDRQWLTIAKIVDTVKTISPDTKIILAATIAPNADSFGDGVLNWPQELKWNSSLITKAYLQNLINFATSEHYPLSDAYHSSLGADGNGKEIYINQGDHIHPSTEGALLFSQKIVETIRKNNLLN